MSSSAQLSELQKTFGDLKSGQNRRTAKRMVRNKSAIQDLQKSLNDNPRFGKMIEYSVSCLKSMAVDPVCCEELIEEGVLETLLKIQKLNPYNEKVSQVVNEFISMLCQNDELAKMVADRIGSGQLIFSCKKHTTPETVSASCHTMAAMMRNIDDNVNMFVQSEIIEALEHVCVNMHDQPNVMANVAECLRCVSRVPEHIPALLKTDILKYLLMALKENPHNANLVRSALAFLASIAAVDGPHIGMLRDMGVVDLIVAALEANAEDKAILKLGAEALRFLAGSNDIFNALRVKVGVTDETANALARLSSLMLVDENIDKMIDAQGIQWLITALQTACAAAPSETSYRILVSGARAVERICADEKKIYAVMQAQGVPTLLQIVSQHGHDENVLVAALAAIAKMITRKENAELFLKCKIMNAVESSRKSHPNSGRIAAQCSEICERLSRHPSIQKSLVDQGIIYRLHEMLKQFAGDVDIVRTCLRALQNMSACPEAVKQMMDLDIAKLIGELLKKYEDNPEIVGLCIDYMAAMARGHPDAADYLKKSGVMKALLSALDKLKDNAALQAHGSELMKLLAGENQLKDAVGTVWSTSQHMIKTPAQAVQYSPKLTESTTLLKNLAQVESNYEQLTQNNAQAAFMSAIEAALLLPATSEQRLQILQDATQGLNALASFSKGDGVAKQILKNGQLFKLLEAVLKDTQDEQTAEYAMSVLAELSQHPALHAELIQRGAVSYAVQIAQLFPYNEVVQGSAATTLGHLASNAAAVAQIVKSGGARTILDSILMNMSNKAELLKALEILRTIAQDPEICAALWDAGVLDAILAVWRKHPKEPEVVDSCLQALVVMLVSEEIALVMGDKGVCELAIPAIRTHFRQPVLIESDVVLLDSLASATPNAVRLLNPDFATIDLMEWVMRKFPNRPTTIEAATRLIETLRGHQQRLENERLAREVERFKFDDASVQELFRDMVNTDKLDELKAMFQKLELLMTNDDVVKMLALNGGLHSMSQLMLAHVENEETFKSAAALFLRMCCKHQDEEINALLQHPLLLRAHAEIIKAHPTFHTQMTEEQVTATAIGLGSIKFNDEGFTALFQSGGLAALSKMLGTCNNSDALREDARVLGKATANEMINTNIVPNMQAGTNGFATIRELIDALRKHINNYEFVRFGIYILGNLAINDDIKLEIGIQSGVLLIIQAINVHHEEMSLIKNAFYSLASLTFNHPINCCFVMASKGIRLTLDTMKLHQDVPDLLDSCLCVLCNMCHGNDGNKTLIIEAEGAKTIVDTVLNNFDQVDVLLSAFRMLGTLAFNAQAVDAIIKAGGVQGIVAGMTVLGDSVEVVDVAIRVLTNLASNCTEDHMKIMAEEGAVQAIVEVMASHTSNVDIELSSCTALVNLSIMHYNADQIIKQGGVEITLKALAAIGYDAEFVDMAIRVLFNLTYSINNLNRIINAGIAPAILVALKGLMSNSGVITIGLRCISNLCYSDDVAGRMAEDGPIEFILALIRHHLAAPEKQSGVIITEGLGCLSALARNENNALAMAQNAISIVSKIISGTAFETSVMIAATRFIANLFVHSAPSIASCETDFIVNLLGLWSRDINNVELLLVAIKPVENMAFAAQSVRDFLKEKRTIEKLDDVKKANGDRQDVIELANAAIYAINRADYAGDSLEFVELNRRGRNLKDVYDALGEKKEEKVLDVIIEIPPKIKNFLTGGALLMKHSMSAPPRPRHIYVTDDMKWIVWKDPKKPNIDEDVKAKIFSLRSVERGRCTPQLKRQRFGKWLAEEKHCFSIQSRERTIDLECSSEKDREKWVHAIEVLLAYKKGLQSANQTGSSFT